MNIKRAAWTAFILLSAIPLAAQDKLSKDEVVSNRLFSRALQVSGAPMQSERFNHLWMAYLVDPSQPAVLEDLAPLITYVDRKWGFQVMEESFRLSGYDYQTGMGLLRQALYYKEWEQAERVADKLLELKPNDKLLIRTLISVYEESGQVEKALATIQKIQGDERDVAVIFKESQMLLQLHREVEAEQLLETYLAVHPGEPIAAVMLVSIYADAGKEDKALALLEKAQKLSPENIQLSELFVSINANLGRNEAIKSEILRIATLEGGDPVGAQQLLSSARSMTNNLTALLPTLIEIEQELQKIYPEVDQLVLAEANDHFLLSDSIKGEKLLMKLVENGTQLPSPYYYFIERYASVEDSVGLRKVTDKGLKAIPTDGLVHLYSALLDINNGDTISSNKRIQKALKVVPEEDRFYGQLALMGAELAMEYDKDWERAVKYFEIAVAKGIPSAYNNYAYALTTHGTPEDLNRAEEMASEAVKNDSENASFLDTYAWILYLKKAYPLARIYMERALEKAEAPDALYFQHYADILTALGEYDKALEALRMALENGGEVATIEGIIKKIKESQNEEK
ncbi:tetratricopeptide repeat protein [Porphyromonas levii]|uniref:Tetratricopeptide repeat protein n=1 Tax=Porphyromonas levii TaxID=28114 RepID=A0A4Y8WRL9_9PORP|nr:tetratricopeptide repeat protein [Porphyromonas levii]MBR8713800.1 Beta-barrel assembly-enhancing protease [Porphyromonas levii]MBR8715818.1 Beta-barrel assembly-enhancing protease [Porphyromonas levii]MBR8728366.1 Beta-barrel assembly-enhancing protease [Porphyromonas levii]MBR8736672.1 Beta-barrel assembly-enhancing protease [Porphyromonas levii]MBR8778760.1 Beta-barrel assembly-enhancing protease [Porphyromonas levii]